MTTITKWLITIWVVVLAYQIFRKKIFPSLLRDSLKEVERNPRWFKARKEYYGFEDMDVVLYEHSFACSPYFKTNKDRTKLEFWIHNDTKVDDAEEMARIALAGKIQAKYGLWFPDKPIYWLSILLYLLDGGDVNMIDKKQETS